MKNMILALATCACILSAPAAVNAQAFSGDWAIELKKDVPAPKTAAQKHDEEDILGLQAALRAAAKAKDKAAIEKYFAPDFTMTHGSGAVHNKALRVDFLAGGGGYEVMTPEEQSIRIINRDAAVSIANNSGMIGGKFFYIRYITVYAKGAPNEGYKGWRTAAAQVVMVPAKAPATEAAPAPAH